MSLALPDSVWFPGWMTAARRMLPVAALLLISACGVHHDAQPGPSAKSASTVTCHGPRVYAGGAGDTTLIAGDVPPMWTAELGFAAEVGDDIVAADDSGCFVAVDAHSGKRVWTSGALTDTETMGVTGDKRIVVAATGHTVGGGGGGAGAAAIPFTNGLVGLDIATGRQRWSMGFPDDGQGIPAELSGDTVVLVEDDGTSLGLDATTGVRRWSATAPSDCTLRHHDDLDPAVVALPGGAPATIVYRCTAGEELARLDPASGAVRWTHPLPSADDVVTQWPAASAGGVVAVSTQRGGMLALDATTGHTLWHDAKGDHRLYAGAGRICLVARSTLGCHAARTGATIWRRSETVDLSEDALDPTAQGVAAYDGRLYLTTATAAAQRIPPSSTTYRATPGAFRLQVIDVATGKVLTDEGLPSYYSADGGVVTSVRTPPGVLAAGAGAIVVSPELQETQTVEIFPQP